MARFWVLSAGPQHHQVHERGGFNWETYRTAEDAKKRARQLNDFARRTGDVYYGTQCFLRIRRKH